MNEDRLADFLNEEPVVFMNCNNTEMMASLGFAFVIGLPISIIAGVLVGNFIVSLLVILVFTLVVAWVFMTYLSQVRERHHGSWFKEKFFMIKIKYGLISTPLLDETKKYRRGKRNG